RRARARLRAVRRGRRAAAGRYVVPLGRSRRGRADRRFRSAAAALRRAARRGRRVRLTRAAPHRRPLPAVPRDRHRARGCGRALGLHEATRAKLDVFPQFAPPQVVMQTEAPGLAAEQVEALVTTPIEAEIAGVEGLEALRSESIQGLSVITAT